MRKATPSILMAYLILTSILALGSATALPTQKTPVIIGFKDKPDTYLVKQHGGEIKCIYHIEPALAARLPPEAIDVLRKIPVIAYVVEDLEIFPVQQTTPWGVSQIGADVVHAYNTGDGINVAIMDTGIDYNHPDLNDNYYGGYDFGGPKQGAPNDPDPMDFNGHGTHCAGIVAAEDNAFGVVGVAPGAHLYALKVFSDDGGGSYSDVIEALEWCIDTHTDGIPGNGIQVISMSFGSEKRYGDPGIEPWIKDAYTAGILLVGAAGNSGNRWGFGDNVIYPARYSSVIAVGASDKSDTRASWSSTGPDLELTAPGVDVNSTWLGGVYEAHSGTSMACPHVTGTAALVMAAYPSWTNVQVREQLQKTADDLGASGRDNQYGYGLVDADEAAPRTDIHDIAVTSISAPSSCVQGDIVSIGVTAKNEGTYNENFDVTLRDTTDSVVIGSESVSLDPGATITKTFSWNTADASLRDHTLKAEASAVTGETDTADNSKTTTVTVKESRHDVAVTGITAPPSVTQGDVANIDVDVANEGTYEETFKVTLKDTTDGKEIGFETVTLAEGGSKTVTFSWDTTDATIGDHILDATASTVEGETEITDNSKTTTVTVMAVEKKVLVVSVVTTDKYRNPKATYKTWETVYILVIVTDNTGNPIQGASCHIVVTNPEGKTVYDKTLNTNASGEIFDYFWLGWRAKTGTYTVKVDATKADHEPASDTTTFEATSSW